MELDRVGLMFILCFVEGTENFLTLKTSLREENKKDEDKTIT